MKTILRLVVGFLFWMLIVSWVVFVYFTTSYLVTGGPARVVQWYMHIPSAGIQSHWNPRRFLIDQIVLLAITVGLYFLRRRLRAGSKPNPVVEGADAKGS